MKKALTLLALTAFVALPSYATYIVVLTNGNRYAAKAKWTVTNGKALVLLENGQSLQLDPSLIDVARSEALTKMGAGANANVIDLNTNAAPEQTTSAAPKTLGDQIKLRHTQPSQTVPAPVTPTPSVSSGQLSSQVLEKFDRAFENIGIYEKKLISTGAHTLRADLTLDTEDRVFNAISATSLLIVRNAGIEGAQIDMVELFMKTTVGGAAGRFQMNRADAEALNQKKISQQEYFVRKVIY